MDKLEFLATLRVGITAGVAVVLLLTLYALAQIRDAQIRALGYEQCLDKDHSTGAVERCMEKYPAEQL